MKRQKNWDDRTFWIGIVLLLFGTALGVEPLARVISTLAPASIGLITSFLAVVGATIGPLFAVLIAHHLANGKGRRQTRARALIVEAILQQAQYHADYVRHYLDLDREYSAAVRGSIRFFETMSEDLRAALDAHGQFLSSVLFPAWELVNRMKWYSHTTGDDETWVVSIWRAELDRLEAQIAVTRAALAEDLR